MGFLSKLFGGDPQKDLEKAESFLGQGRPDRALDLARKVAGADDETLAEAGREMMAKARRTLIDNALTMAEEAEASEFWEDGLEWLDRALEQIEDADKRAEVIARRLKMEKALEASEAEEWEAPQPVEQSSQEDELVEQDEDGHFIALVDMMEEEVGRLYLAQEDIFRGAYLALYDGRPGDAIPTLNELVEAKPDDPVLRFERGRALLFTGDAAAAREDLEMAWETWGDIYLDRAGTLSVAGEWAESLLALNEPGPILERLEAPAHPGTGQPELSLAFGRALVQAERFEDAEPFLLKAMENYPDRSEFGLLLAQILEHQERRRDAVQCLEIVIAPSCASGSCSAPRRHMPSFRMLTALYLATEKDSEDEKTKENALRRAEELLAYIREGSGGMMALEDVMLMAELCRRQGDETEAARWMEIAEQAVSASEQKEVVKSEAPKMSAETPI